MKKNRASRKMRIKHRARAKLCNSVMASYVLKIASIPLAKLRAAVVLKARRYAIVAQRRAAKAAAKAPKEKPFLIGGEGSAA